MTQRSLKALASALTLSVSCTLFACSDDGAAQNGSGEDFVVRNANAQFLRKPLPGSEPEDGGTTMPTSDAGADALPEIAQVLTSNFIVAQGQGGKDFHGFATDNTYAVAVALDDTHAGYWVIPVGAPDPVMGGLTWSITADFGNGIGAGHHDLRVVAIDKHGHAGTQATLTFCIASRVPDNLHACQAMKAPPRAVIALTWDTQVDLDLQVIAPNGTVIDGKHPTTGEPGMEPDDGKLDRDSNAQCVIDGVRAESMVWNTTMPHGKYGMYVNLYDSCKQPAVRFNIAVYTAVSNHDGKGGQDLKLWFEKGGELTAIQENGGAARGLFVSEFAFH